MDKLLSKFKENKNIFFELIGIFLYGLVLQIGYVLANCNNGHWTTGYYIDYNFIKFIFSYIIISFLFFRNEKIESDFIKFYNKVFIYLMIVPISIVYSIQNLSTIMYIFIIIEFFIIVEGLKILNKIKFQKQSNTKFLKKISHINFTNMVYILFWFLTIIVIAFCFKYNGFPKLTALNLYNVYKIREKFYLPKYIQYLYDFVTKFIILFLIVVNLQKKRYKIMGIVCGILLMFFLWKGDKMVLLSCPLVIMVYLIFSKIDYKKYFERNIIWLIIYASIFSIILYFINIRLLVDLFITRLLIIPAKLKFVYIDFFSNHDKIGFLGTIFNSIIHMKNPYMDMDYQNILSDIYFNRPDMYSNTGFLIEGFARWGYIGFLIIPIIYVMVLKLLDIASKNTSFAFMISISIIPLMMLNDGYLIPTLTFGAIGLLCFISAFFKIDKLETGKYMSKISTKLRRK